MSVFAVFMFPDMCFCTRTMLTIFDFFLMYCLLGYDTKKKKVDSEAFHCFLTER